MLNNNNNDDDDPEENAPPVTALTNKQLKHLDKGLNDIGNVSRYTRTSAINKLAELSGSDRARILTALKSIGATEGNAPVYKSGTDADTAVSAFLKLPVKDMIKELEQLKKRTTVIPPAKSQRKSAPPPPPQQGDEGGEDVDMEELRRRLNQIDQKTALTKPAEGYRPHPHTSSGHEQAHEKHAPLENPPVDENYPNLRPPPTQYQTQSDNQNYQEGLDSTLDNMSDDNNDKGKQVPEELAKGVFETFYAKASEIGMGMATYAFFLPALFGLMLKGFTIDPDVWFNAIGAKFDPDTLDDQQLDEIEDHTNRMLEQQGSDQRISLVHSKKRRRRKRRHFEIAQELSLVEVEF